MQAQEQIPFNELPRGNGEPGAVRAISDLLKNQGFDANSRLYDEALLLAREGHLGRARDRLRMLLCIDPDDAEAHLLLAKVFGAQKLWQQGIAELDTAAACGVKTPLGLKEAFEATRDANLSDNRAEQVAARVGAEVRALREEARRLRVDKTRLERASRESNRKARGWSLTAVLSTALAVGLLLAILTGGMRGEANTLDDATADVFLEIPEATVHTSTLTPVVETTTLEDTPLAVADMPETAADFEVVSTTANPTSEATTYVVVPGDNLSAIAQKVYGKSSVWRALLEANSDVLGGNDSLQVGMTLHVPTL
jgi:LysM repeat protein